MLDAEADNLSQARRYERSPDRQDTRTGRCKCKLYVTAKEVELQVPKLRHLSFVSAIIERYRRCESS
jgi:putative transposase